MSRVYISGAITGVENYQEIFSEAEKKLENLGFEVINPARIGIEGLTWEEYMEIDLVLMKNCGYMYQLPGWRESRGALVEYGYALARDITILEGEI